METIFTDGQLTKMIETMRQKGMTPERFNQLLSSGIFADVCDASACLDDRDGVRRALKLLREKIPLSVNYARPLEEMIAAGRYIWEDNNINSKRFPVKGEGTVEFEAKLFHFARDIFSVRAIKAMKEEGYEPAAIEHLLSFGEKYPEEQCSYPIIALGSVASVDRTCRVPCLDTCDSERRLRLGWFEDDLHGYRFLAVRKVSGA